MPTAAVYLGKPGTRKASGEWSRRQPLRGAGRFRYCVSCHTDSAAYPAPACPVLLPDIGSRPHTGGAPRHGSHFCTFPFATSL